MLVFISWSGPRSKAVAEALESWLRQVIQAVDPWISADIQKGLRWGPEMSARLAESKVGIICLTPENLNERWILFEAGALSKAQDAHVCTLLLDLKPTDVEQPLAQFQHTSTKKQEVLALLKVINGMVEKNKERSLTEKVLSEVFEKNWPDLEKQIDAAMKLVSKETNVGRSQDAMLQEILELARNQERRLAYIEATIDFSSVSEGGVHGVISGDSYDFNVSPPSRIDTTGAPLPLGQSSRVSAATLERMKALGAVAAKIRKKDEER